MSIKFCNTKLEILRTCKRRERINKNAKKASQMYNCCACLFVVLTILWLKYASSTYTVSSNNNLLSEVPTKSCPSDGVPVCGERNQQFLLFPNDCLLKEVNKNLLSNNTSFKKVSLKYCLNGCQLLCSKIFHPICGKNVKTGEYQLFANQCEVMKFACQTNVEYNKVNISDCKNPKQLTSTTKFIKKRAQIHNRVPIPCTNILKPVCGIYMGVKSSFRNECLLNEENVKFNRDWRFLKNGVCAEDFSNVRQKQKKFIKPHFVKKRSFGSNFYDYNNEYDTENFNDFKILPNVVPNNVYLYMPPGFETEYLNYDANNFHQSVPFQKAFDEIYNKIIALPQIHSKHEISTKKSEEQNKFKHGMNFNYIPDLPQSIKEIKEILSDTDGYHYTLENSNYDVKSEEKTATTTSSTSINLNYTSETSKIVPATTVITNTYKHLKKKKNYEKTKENECKFGHDEICGILANGTVQSFNTVCEMMSANINLKNTWVKLHDGICEACTFNCSKEYKPICVTRNGVNYTMINDCYFNMGICMDKKSKWKKLTEGECERYTRIPDKYAYSKPGFSYTSDYFVTDRTSTIAINSLTLPTFTEKPSELKSSRIKKRRPNPKRAINRHSSLCRCSSTPRYCNSLVCANVNYRYVQTTTKTIPTMLTLYGPQTESYIMRLVKNKANQ